jgi:hypothetical protein
VELEWSQPPVKPNEHSLGTLVERSQFDPEFEDVWFAVEIALQGVGARVKPLGLSYTGEMPYVTLEIPDDPAEKAKRDAEVEARARFSNRPA